MLKPKTMSVKDVCSKALNATTQHFSCENCVKMFQTNSELEKHYIVYEFGCEICGICKETNILASLHEFQKHPYSELQLREKIEGKISSSVIGPLLAGHI